MARTSPSNTGIRVQALLRELKSHKPHGQKNQNIKQKHYCNKFNKDFKNGVKKKKKISTCLCELAFKYQVVEIDYFPQRMLLLPLI